LDVSETVFEIYFINRVDFVYFSSCNKILKLCLFDEPSTGKRWCTNVQSRQFEVLCVSQFTLYTTLKGNKPDFHLAMEPTKSKELYESLLTRLRTLYQADKIHDGEFGAMMQVNIVNDGPVTIDIESPQIPAKINKRDLSQQMQKVNINEDDNNETQLNNT